MAIVTTDASSTADNKQDNAISVTDPDQQMTMPSHRTALTATTATTLATPDEGTDGVISASPGGADSTSMSTPVATSRKQIDVCSKTSGRNEDNMMTPHDTSYDVETMEEKKESEALVAPETPANIHQSASECETMLLEATVDDCVGCMDGVDVQTNFEAQQTQPLEDVQRQIAIQHGLSEAEAALIRFQIIGAAAAAGSAPGGTTTNPSIQSSKKTASTALMPRFDAMLNVCGNDDSVSESLCEGVVLPIDTTLPTSLPMGRRSLVDVIEPTITTPGGPSNTKTEDGAPKTQNATVTTGPECVICDASASMDGRTSGTTALVGMPTFCKLPCCESSLSSSSGGSSNDGGQSIVNVCTACILVLTVATKDGKSRIGRCPRCRTWISATTLHSTRTELEVEKLDMTPGTCQSCQLFKSPIVEDGTCDACFLGKHAPLMYECEECHNSQEIDHALYRCQTTPQSFGNEMSPCSSCQKSTHWRLVYDNLPSIPANDVPEEWGDDTFLELARAKVQKARRGIAAQLDSSIVDSSVRANNSNTNNQMGGVGRRQVPLLKRKTSVGDSTNASDGCSIM